jgi:hypothetical protein
MKNFARISLSLVTLAGLAGLATAGDGDVTAPAATMPKPPADIAAVAKAMVGTWKCTGTAMDAAAKEVPTKGTFKNKSDLDGWWLTTSFAETKKGGFKFTSLMSFDDKAKKWTKTMFDNMGGRETTESTGMKDNKVEWKGTSVGPMGTMQSRHNEQIVSPKEVHMMGEYSQDGTKWMKAYDLVCKK